MYMARDRVRETDREKIVHLLQDFLHTVFVCSDPTQFLQDVLSSYCLHCGITVYVLHL